jgi:hypothetical protein
MIFAAGGCPSAIAAHNLMHPGYSPRYSSGRTLILTRRTELTADQKMLVRQLKLDLPPQPPPRITAKGKAGRAPANAV